MSLLYIIDGYNIINHTKFPHTNKKIKDSRKMLLEFIKTQKLSGSSKNRTAVVFDGYPNLSSQKLDEEEISVIFSKEETADSWIKKMLETQVNPKNTVVVSDDKEIRFFVKVVGARSIGVEEFIHPALVRRSGVHPATKHRARINCKEKSARALQERDLLKPELTYSQIDKINQELKALWLKNKGLSPTR